MKNRKFILVGALLGMLGVGLGAFGAHAFEEFLKKIDRLDTYETAVKYLFYHALALLLVGNMSQSRWTKYAGNLFIVGTLIFSSSLLLICLTGIKTFGAVAPIGGTALVLGWGMLAWGALKDNGI